MKLKYFFLIFVLFLSVIFGVVKYYHLDPSFMARLSFYANLANPDIKIIKIQEGLRKEQIADLVGKKLNWNEEQKYQFTNLHTTEERSFEGHYFPATYFLSKDDSPSEVGETMFQEFNKKTSAIKLKSKDVLNEQTILTIASIIQREAGGKHDMALISGIIWNRIFSGMKLQMDATLQYVKGSEVDGWWREVRPEDKKLTSLYNTYIHKGLPPSAIANPGLAAISAAYNPQKTKCLFYLHDRNRQIHCAVTYEEHKRNIQTYYK